MLQTKHALDKTELLTRLFLVLESRGRYGFSPLSNIYSMLELPLWVSSSLSHLSGVLLPSPEGQFLER